MIIVPFNGVALADEQIELLEGDFEIVSDPMRAEKSFNKHKLLSVSGPTIWIFILTGILTRYIKIKGKEKLLLKIHKICGYSVLIGGTCHGIIGLFF